jgi:hypothetical protein
MRVEEVEEIILIQVLVVEHQHQPIKAAVVMAVHQMVLALPELQVQVVAEAAVLVDKELLLVVMEVLVL